MVQKNNASYNKFNSEEYGMNNSKRNVTLAGGSQYGDNWVYKNSSCGLAVNATNDSDWRVAA